MATLLRKALKGSVDIGQNKAHWFDLELAAYALKHTPGPKPSKEYILAIADVLKDKANWRPLGEKKNKYGIERETVDEILSSADTNKIVYLSPGKLIKVKHQIQFLIDNQDKLPASFVEKMTRIFKKIRDPVDPNKHLISTTQVKNGGVNFLSQKKKKTSPSVPKTPPKSKKKAAASASAASPGTAKHPDKGRVAAAVKAADDKARAAAVKRSKVDADKARKKKAVAKAAAVKEADVFIARAAAVNGIELFARQETVKESAAL